MTGRHTYRLILIFSIVIWPALTFAQDNPEEEYFRIRSLAFSGDHETARTEARRLVNAYPEYGDARILLARITAWQNDFPEAEAILDTLLQSEPQNSDALSLKQDIERWSKKTMMSSTDLVTGYSFDHFNEPYTLLWQIFKAGASHRFNWGSGALFVNTGHVIYDGASAIRATELQFEAEAYPRLSAKNYAYLDYAYSPGQYFPRHKAAAEIWQVLPKGWAVSAGLNYYYWRHNIFIASASVEKYLGKYWISVKGYVYFKDIGATTSGYLNIRRYFDDFDYIQLTAGTGTAPDESFTIINQLERLNATSVRLTYFNRFPNAMTLRLGAGYSNEDYETSESDRRDRFEGNITLTFPIGNK